MQKHSQKARHELCPKATSIRITGLVKQLDTARLNIPGKKYYLRVFRESETITRWVTVNVARSARLLHENWVSVARCDARALSRRKRPKRRRQLAAQGVATLLSVRAVPATHEMTANKLAPRPRAGRPNPQSGNSKVFVIFVVLVAVCCSIEGRDLIKEGEFRWFFCRSCGTVEGVNSWQVILILCKFVMVPTY